MNILYRKVSYDSLCRLAMKGFLPFNLMFKVVYSAFAATVETTLATLSLLLQFSSYFINTVAWGIGVNVKNPLLYIGRMQ